MKNYSKLVRDGIIEKIRVNGDVASYRQATDEEFPAYVARKVREEARELSEALLAGSNEAIIEEIADLREIVDEVIALRGISNEAIAQIQKQKRYKVGAFGRRWILNIL